MNGQTRRHHGCRLRSPLTAPSPSASPVDGHDRRDRSIQAPKFQGPPIFFSPVYIFCSPDPTRHDRSFICQKIPVATHQFAFQIVMEIQCVSTTFPELMFRVTPASASAVRVAACALLQLNRLFLPVALCRRPRFSFPQSN
jgi:hypothetical protein